MMGWEVVNMMAAARKEMPLGGKRAKMGTGRARVKQLGIWIDEERAATLARLADAEGITRTALIERWIDEHAASLRNQQAPDQAPE
jgi:hypothetical protein